MKAQDEQMKEGRKEGRRIKDMQRKDLQRDFSVCYLMTLPDVAAPDWLPGADWPGVVSGTPPPVEKSRLLISEVVPIDLAIVPDTSVVPGFQGRSMDSASTTVCIYSVLCIHVYMDKDCGLQIRCDSASPTGPQSPQ